MLISASASCILAEGGRFLYHVKTMRQKGSLLRNPGALMRLYFPVWLPYTVGLLIVSLIFGIIAQAAFQGTDCPSRAFAYAGDDHVVSRKEWNRFIGAQLPVTKLARDELRVVSVDARPGAPTRQ